MSEYVYRTYASTVFAVYVRRSGDEDNGEIETVWSNRADADKEVARLMPIAIEVYVVEYLVIAPGSP